MADDTQHRINTDTDTDPNDAVWRSAQAVSHWVSTAGDRERRRTAQRALMADLLPFEDHQAFVFVDLGAGTGAAAAAVLDHYPRAHAILAEYSPQMMAEGHRALASYTGRYSYVELDLASVSWPATMPSAVDAVISSLCVHHLPDPRKQELFAQVLRHLVPGGWYLNYDPVSPHHPAVESAWRRAADRQDPGAAAARAHRTPEEEQRYQNHIRYMSPLDRQLGFLQEAGFVAIDVFWKVLDEVIYGGQRPQDANTGSS